MVKSPKHKISGLGLNLGMQQLFMPFFQNFNYIVQSVAFFCK